MELGRAQVIIRRGGLISGLNLMTPSMLLGRGKFSKSTVAVVPMEARAIQVQEIGCLLIMEIIGQGTFIFHISRQILKLAIG